MKASKKLGLLLSVAEIVLQYGADLTIELKDCRRSSSIVRGAISESETIDGGIVLHASFPAEANDTAEEGDDE